MKKCLKCRVIEDDDKTRCPHCGSFLTVSTGQDDSFEMSGLSQEDDRPGEPEIPENLRIGDHGYMLYAVGRHCKRRDFFFLYRLSRHDFKMGQKFRRGLVDPLTLGSILKIPWFVINVVDSLIILLRYRKFCNACGWKYHKHLPGGKHDPTECEYNQEHYSLIKEILIGHIVDSDGEFRKESIVKIKAGKKSAYRDLHDSRRKSFWIMTDAVCLFLSLAVIVFPIVVLLLYLTAKGIVWLQKPLL